MIYVTLFRSQSYDLIFILLNGLHYMIQSDMMKLQNLIFFPIGGVENGLFSMLKNRK